MNHRKQTPVDEFPFFARPLEEMRAELKAGERRSAVAGYLLLGLPTLLLCGTLMAVAKPQNVDGTLGKPTVVKVQGDKTAVEASPAVEESTDNDRRPFSFYTQGVRSGMFSAPLPPEPPKPKPIKLPPPPPPKPVIVMPINPFADWSYSGTIKMGSEIMVLLENTKTKEGKYLRNGESFMGAQVTGITDQMVTLTSAGKPVMLAKADTITTTPLDKSAPYLSGAPGGQPGMPGMPGQPGMPQPAPNAQMGGGNNMVILPNGQTLTPERAARRSRRLNRTFNR